MTTKPKQVGTLHRPPLFPAWSQSGQAPAPQIRRKRCVCSDEEMETSARYASQRTTQVQVFFDSVVKASFVLWSEAAVPRMTFIRGQISQTS